MTVSLPSPSAPDRPILAGRSALVTGVGPAGIVTARALASAGASVALAGADDLALLRTARAIEARGGLAVPLPADVRDAEALRRVVASAKESFGSLDLAINTVGGVDGPRSDVHAGCRATYLAMSFELPALIASGGGAVVNAVANPLGRHAEESHCIAGLTRAAALDHLDRGVRVNAIVSGGSPAEFAAVAVWLCSERAEHVTGAAIPAGLRPAPVAQPTQPGRTSPYS
jgi:NAD(P)-dependent dehydrogenase (short-subunit alcohol dehydrogenase family)